MTEWPHLKNAPITEALIDISVQLPSSVSVEDLAKIQKSVSTDYPSAQERRAWKVELKASGTESKDEGVNGFLCRSKDGTQVVQYRLDGFTFSRLKPYTHWGSVYSEAKRLWDMYEKTVCPVSISRVTVKYINSISIPAKMPMRLEDYFNGYPEVPDTMVMGNFLLNFGTSFPDNIQATVTQASQFSADGNPLFLLDIDVSSGRENPIEGAWSKIETLRDIKNEIFFKFLKEKTLELFK